tara:strand:+ start:7065 stop:7745 length:681 start_codon:yes stop_codon:yes gene_type:complete
MFEDKNHANKVSLQYSNGEVIIFNDGDIAGIQIQYECTGKINLNPPDNWLYSSNDNIIIMASINGDGNIDDGSVIFNYDGDLNIIQATIATWDKKAFTIKPHTTTDDSNFIKGTIYQTTDKISNAGGVTTIANSNKKISETTNDTFIKKITIEEVKLDNTEEIRQKFLEESGFNVDGYVGKRKVRRQKSTRQKMFSQPKTAKQGAIPRPQISVNTGGSGGGTGGGY